MTSGEDHDNAIKVWTIPISIVLSLIFGWRDGIIGGAAFFIGGLWLSPDLDTNSLSFKRWGILKIFWWPYQKMIPHRSIISHGPLIGTFFRIGYLIFLGSFMALLLNEDSIFVIYQGVIEIIKKNNTQIFASFIGLEASAWLHLIKDGDP